MDFSVVICHISPSNYVVYVVPGRPAIGDRIGLAAAIYTNWAPPEDREYLARSLRFDGVDVAHAFQANTTIWLETTQPQDPDSPVIARILAAIQQVLTTNGFFLAERALGSHLTVIRQLEPAQV